MFDLDEATMERLVMTGVAVAGAVVLYLVAIRLGSRFVSRISQSGHDAAMRAATLWAILRRLGLVVVAVVAILVLLDVWGFGLGPFVAVGGAIGIALGFGAQDLVKDVIAGFFILAEDQFHIGDVITISGISGTVEDIQLRATVLRDVEGVVHYIPNGQITVTSNLTSTFAQPVVEVGVAYKEDVDRAMSVIADEMSSFASDPEWTERINGEPEMVGVTELADSAVIIRARLHTPAADRWTVKREALRRIKKRLDAEGIEIPFPHLTVYRGDA